jgi:hypothetical protein
MSTITIYRGSETTYTDTYPAAWSFKALQKLARNWMKYTGGTRYQIDQAGVVYYSKPNRKAAN